jgi:hypothetical protein
VTRLGVLLLRPYERWWAWYVKRQYRRGRFARPQTRE